LSVLQVGQLLAVLMLSTPALAKMADPKKCSAQLLTTYTQKALEKAGLKAGQARRQILISTLIKLRDLCAVNDDGSELAEYFTEKVRDSVEISLDIENRLPAWEGGNIANAVANVQRLAKTYVQSSKSTSHCLADRSTTSGITALYADRFHEEFIGFLKQNARVHILHPHLLRSSLSGAVIKVQVISNTDDGSDHAHEGRIGFISAADTDWHDDCF